MKYVTKNCEVRKFNVSLYEKETKSIIERVFSDDSGMTEKQLEKAASAMFNAKVLEMELVDTINGIHRLSYEKFIKLSTIVDKAVPGCVNRNIAVTEYTVFLYDKSSRSVQERVYTDYDEREPEQVLKDINKALKAANDKRIAVDIEPIESSARMRSVPLSKFMEKAEKVETA